MSYFPLYIDGDLIQKQMSGDGEDDYSGSGTQDFPNFKVFAGSGDEEEIDPRKEKFLLLTSHYMLGKP